jgi:hypothetical protein
MLMRNLVALFALAVLAAGPIPARAQENLGTVVIGWKAEGEPLLVWREIEEASGKLLPPKTEQYQVRRAGSVVGQLFKDFGGEFRNGKPVDVATLPTKHAVRDLPPGTYVLEGLFLRNRWTTFNGEVPVVRVRPGRASYVGDFGIQADKDGATAMALGQNLDTARSAPGGGAALTQAETGRATLDCKRERYRRSIVFVCDERKSKVTGIRFSQ